LCLSSLAFLFFRQIPPRTYQSIAPKVDPFCQTLILGWAGLGGNGIVKPRGELAGGAQMAAISRHEQQPRRVQSWSSQCAERGHLLHLIQKKNNGRTSSLDSSRALLFIFCPLLSFGQNNCSPMSHRCANEPNLHKATILKYRKIRPKKASKKLAKGEDFFSFCTIVRLGKIETIVQAS